MVVGEVVTVTVVALVGMVVLVPSVEVSAVVVVDSVDASPPHAAKTRDMATTNRIARFMSLLEFDEEIALPRRWDAECRTTRSGAGGVQTRADAGADTGVEGGMPGAGGRQGSARLKVGIGSGQ